MKTPLDELRAHDVSKVFIPQGQQHKLDRHELLSRLTKVSDPAFSKLGRELAPTEEENEGIGLITSFLKSFAPPKPTSHKRDFQLMKKVVGAIAEAAEEEILTSREVDLLLNFFAGRFIQRRVDRIMQKTFEPSSHWQCSFRAFKSSAK